MSFVGSKHCFLGNVPRCLLLVVDIVPQATPHCAIVGVSFLWCLLLITEIVSWETLLCSFVCKLTLLPKQCPMMPFVCYLTSFPRQIPLLPFVVRWYCVWATSLCTSLLVGDIVPQATSVVPFVGSELCSLGKNTWCFLFAADSVPRERPFCWYLI